MTEREEKSKENFTNYSLAELLEALDEEIDKQRGKEELSLRTYQLVAELGVRELFTCERIVTCLLERLMSTGVLELLKKQQLLTILPWKKTRAREWLERLVAEGILNYHKRKYALNLENPFVLRVKQSMWFKYKEFDLEALLQEFVKEQRGKEKKKKKEEPVKQRPIVQYQPLSNQEYLQFVKEIHRLTGQVDEVAEEELEDFLKQNILKIIGWTKKEKK